MVRDAGELQSRKVCVVGAGMAGLAAARELRREGHAVTVLEQNADVGGQWLYDSAPDAGDPLGRATPVRVTTGIYANLRLLSPRQCMGFSDFQFLPRPGRDPRRLPGHREVFLYLKDFSDEFNLMDVVRLNTKVVRVAVEQATGAGDVPKWVVTSIHLGEKEKDGEVEEKVFDAVVVANGHYSQPRLPSIEGMEQWRRRQLHSHSYRVPDPFRDEVVVVVGCGDSGMDIALDLCAVASEVHLSAKSPETGMTPAMPKMLANHANIRLHPQISRLCDDGRVVFADGSHVVADTVLYCTGYTYSFPFLDTGGAVTVDDNRVGPLFEHVFPPSFAPWLSFVGIPIKVFVPWFFQAQARWVAQVLSGRQSLPPEAEMARWVEELYCAKELAGVPKKYTHDISSGDEFLRTREFVEKKCGMAAMEGWKVELLLSTVGKMTEDRETFRDRNDDDSDDVRNGIQTWLGLSAEAQARDGDGEAAVAMSHGC